MRDTTTSPNQMPWPPIIYVGCVLAGVALHLQWPTGWPTGLLRPALMALGAALLIATVAIYVSSIRAFRRHKTTIQPHRGASALITDGPFRYSRNPIYLANTCAVFGAGLLAGSGWLLLAAVIAAGIAQKLAIEREERHLAANFGEAWRHYALKTPRWLGWR
jgi:protein-S-isoprenylcysteine O-methyltransferase Ste14